MAKWIKFEERDLFASRVTREWDVTAKQGNGFLGTVKWYGGWRRYCFFPEAGSLYEQDCLRDIAQFCETETAKHKAIRAAAVK